MYVICTMCMFIKICMVDRTVYVYTALVWMGLHKVPQMFLEHHYRSNIYIYNHTNAIYRCYSLYNLVGGIYNTAWLFILTQA